MGEKMLVLLAQLFPFFWNHPNDSVYLNLIKINLNGDIDYQEILSNEENPVPFMVSKGIVIDNAIYFLGRKGKEKQMLKVILN